MLLFVIFAKIDNLTFVQVGTIFQNRIFLQTSRTAFLATSGGIQVIEAMTSRAVTVSLPFNQISLIYSVKF